MKSKISHIEINVLDYVSAIKFYDRIFKYMGIIRTNCMDDWTAYSDGQTKIILGRTEDKYIAEGYHRKRAGLNHLAFYAESKEDVDLFYKDVLLKNNIDSLYEKGGFGDDIYYAVFFEGPDRMKLEYVFSPNYCDLNTWPCNIKNDFDPYAK